MENYQISMGEFKKLLDMRVKALQINTGGKMSTGILHGHSRKHFYLKVLLIFNLMENLSSIVSP